MSELIKLSASRIKTLQSCSWTYYCNYNLKLPQKNNSGAMRGTVAHLIFEVLGNPKHKHYIKKIVKDSTCLKQKAIFRLIIKAANREGLDLDEMVKPLKKSGQEISNLKCIDEMILVGLKFDFIGDAKLIGTEWEFDITNKQPAYRIGGFIDRIFKDKKQLVIRDFKSSKLAFKGEELESNIQAMMYSLAVRKKYDKQKEVLVKFLFLRYPDNPERECPHFTEEQLVGFEHYLEYLNGYLTNFDEKKGKSNFAANDFAKKWMCQTKSGWRCPYLDPIDYKVLLDKDNRIIKSTFADKEFKISDVKKDYRIETRRYEGCPAWSKSNNDFGF
jgi:PD-(D/E)XK nuclease superfamily